MFTHVDLMKLIDRRQVAGLVCIVQLAACGPPSPPPAVRSPEDGPRALIAAVKANDVSAIDAAIRAGVDPTSERNFSLKSAECRPSNHSRFLW
jgi:hypothetical protein